jgi:hypothetical protein
VDRAADSSGSPLPTDLRTHFESSLGKDLSGVRLHTGTASVVAAHAVGAKAYTVGQDVHFGKGHYDPVSHEGKLLLAHEVAHTAQQEGASPRRQNKLEVSSPGDAAEIEADKAATAMVSGEQASVSRSSGISRQVIQREPTMVFEDDEIQAQEKSLAEKMESEANEEQRAADAEGPIHVRVRLDVGPLKLAELSSLETVAQARACMQKVTAANANLYQRRAAESAKVADLNLDRDWQEREQAEALVKKTDEHLGQNEAVIANLQTVVDLGDGNSLVDKTDGHRPGHDFRMGVFAQLAQAALIDFARIEGVVGAFLDKHELDTVAEGREGGAELGTAVATGGNGGGDAALDQVKAKIDTARQDNLLNNHMRDYEAALAGLEGGGYSEKINGAMGQCAGAISKAKNLKADTDLGQVRPDTPEQAAAQAAVDAVNQDLSAAKGALGQAADIAKLAVSVMTGPVGISAAGVTGSSVFKTGSKVADKTSEMAKGAARVTGEDVQKQVSADIASAVAKMMTNYDKRITSAQGKVDSANRAAKAQVIKLNKNQANVAKAEIIEKFQALSAVCSEIEEKKAAIRAAAMKIDAYQKEQEKKGKKGGPDIGAMAKAQAECAAYITGAEAAIDQGKEEQAIAKEMSAAREKAAGGMSRTTGELATPDMAGGRELASSTKQDAYIDCEPAAPFHRSQHPLSFRIRSEKTGDLPDKAGKNVEVANMGVAAVLDELRANVEVAAGFQSALKRAMGL